MGEFVCNIVAQFVSGTHTSQMVPALQIDQRTKIAHCKAHMQKMSNSVGIWRFSAAERKDCAAYDALCDYFVEKQRAGLVQTEAHYVYLVPPIAKYLKELSLPSSNFAVAIQIP